MKNTNFRQLTLSMHCRRADILDLEHRSNMMLWVVQYLTTFNHDANSGTINRCSLVIQGVNRGFRNITFFNDDVCLMGWTADGNARPSICR